MENIGYDTEEISKIKKFCEDNDTNYVLNDDEPQGDEYVHFYFVGQYEGREVIFDSAMFTLRLYHSSLLYEKAEEEAEKQFPTYKRTNFDDLSEAEIEKIIDSTDENEEVEVFKMEIIDELEDTEAIKVKEYIEINTDFDYGIALEIGLNVEELTDNIISDFVNKFNTNTLVLDETLYSYKTEEEEEN